MNIAIFLALAMAVIVTIGFTSNKKIVQMACLVIFCAVIAYAAVGLVNVSVGAWIGAFWK